MSDEYSNALRTIAFSYEAERSAVGGKTLSTVATIVVSSGSFFDRLRDGKPFLVHNLERLAAYFRDPANWPDESIPHDAALALTSMGRPPLAATMTHPCRTMVREGNCDRPTISQRSAQA